MSYDTATPISPTETKDAERVAAGPPESLAGDLMRGAKPIADFLGLSPRQVYHLSQTGRLPIKNFDGYLMARKSELVRAISCYPQEVA